MQRTHKTRLLVNNQQSRLLDGTCGCARFAYNWALSEWNGLHDAGEKTSQYDLRKKLNAVKHDEFPWMLEYTKCAPQNAIIDLGRAFDNFFAGRAAHPKFHKKGVHESFRISSDQYSVDGDRVRLPKIGWVRIAEPFRYPGAKLQSATIRKSCGEWFVSISCDTDIRTRGVCKDGAVGIDMGVREHALSTGELIGLPRSYRKSESRLRRAQQSLSRKKKGSANYRKAKLRVQKLHRHVADIRADFIHKLSARLTSDFSIIGIEDLNIKGMEKNRHLAKSVLDAGMSELRRQILYKSEESGSEVVLIDRWYPSTKICTSCGAKAKRMPLGVREWDCPSCGVHHHRDINAAINIKNYAIEQAVSSTVPACGEFFASTVSSRDVSASNLCEAGTYLQIALSNFV